MKPKAAGTWLGLILLVTTAACSGSSAQEADGFDPTEGVATTITLPPVTIEAPPESGPDSAPAAEATTTTVPPIAPPPASEIARIVSLSPTHTETLFALDLGHLVVAVDSASDYPSAALDVRQPNLIAESASLDELLTYDPDVVLVGEDFTGIVGRLSAAGIASWSGPPATSLDDVYRQIEELGDVVGFRDRADELVGRMSADLHAIVKSIPPGTQLNYFYEVDPSYVTITPGSFLDVLLGELGLTTISPDSDDAFTQLSPDVIISAAPDVIILADANCCDVGIDQVAARPGWSTIPALASGAVVTVDDAVASRWGPRTIEFLQSVAGAVIAAS